MKSKIVSSLIVFLLAATTCSLLHNIVAPETNTDLALRQSGDFVDPSTGSSIDNPVDVDVVRTVGKAENLVDPVIFGGAILIVVFMWKKEIKVAVTEKKG